METGFSTQLITYFYGYALFVYFDFSGYSDIVIGTGRLMGLRLPENFAYPFLSAQPKVIWKRWHMSFTDWLQTYLFNPMMKWSTKKTRGKRPVLCFTICYFLAFLFAGAWHGTVPIVVWGIVTAGTIVFLEVGELWLRKGIGKEKFQRVFHSPAASFLGVFLTFHFICYTFSLIGLAKEQLLAYHLRLLGLFS